MSGKMNVTGISRRSVLAATLAAAFGLGSPYNALAQNAADWPSRQITMIVPYAAGGATDVIARLICEALARRLKQPVIVENRSGAGSNVGAGAVAAAPADGSTFLFTNTAHAVNRALYANLSYDPAKDLTPVSVIAEGPMVLLVPSSSPAKTLDEFVKLARAKPGGYSYGTSGTGGALQLVSLLFAKSASLQMQDVPYRGGGPAATDLIAGRIEMLYDAGITGFPLAQSGQARALAVSSAQRSPVMPDVPTVAEAGYPAATFSVWQAILAPSATPAPIIEKLQRELAAALGDGPLRTRLTELGAERVLANTPAEARSYVAGEFTRWEAVLKEAGVRPQ
jgi:tripartite-type tricarboxylate transporter receptor subunit TctC